MAGPDSRKLAKTARHFLVIYDAVCNLLIPKGKSVVRHAYIGVGIGGGVPRFSRRGGYLRRFDATSRDLVTPAELMRYDLTAELWVFE